MRHKLEMSAPARRLRQLTASICTFETEAVAFPDCDPRFTRSGGTAMVHIPQITRFASSSSPQMPAMCFNESERNSQTWLQDFASSSVPGKEMTAGLFRMNAGPALEYVYTYEEMKLIVDGEFHLTDGTGQKVVAKAGDVMYFPKGSRITFATPKTALGYFCGQRPQGTGDFVEPVTDPTLQKALDANPQMVHCPRGTKSKLPKMAANKTERDSQTWLGDIALSQAPDKELAAGFFRMNAGSALEYYYDYEEMKYIVEGEFHLTDGTGQHVVAKEGDLVYFPRGSSVIFNTPKTALGFFCGQRVEDVPILNARDYGQHRMPPMLFAGKLDDKPIPLTFLDPDRPMDGRYMGIKSLKPDYSRWLMIDSTYKEQMAAKAHLLRDPKAMLEVVVTEEAEPEASAKTLAAKKEVLRLVVENILHFHPDKFEMSGNLVKNKLLGEDVALDSDEDPLLTACRLVQEDFSICEPISDDNPGLVRVSCGCVFFPMRWSLREKVGRRLTQIHGPVAAFQKHYLRSAHTFFGTLAADGPISRGNWAVFDDVASTTDLYQPASSESRAQDYPKPTSLAEAGRQYFLRIEYQTLRRLPETGATLFTIRTYQLPLESMAALPFEASVLASRIRTLDPDFAAYKNATSWKDWALKYLDSVADASAPAQGVP